ncbi:MAG: hypothetical protein GXZ11_06485 [Tissierellia bacterium]|nr:hypothetical protein [Tissierellia bacterium]
MKKISVLLIALLLLTSCSPQFVKYNEENAKVSAWEHSTMEMNGTFELTPSEALIDKTESEKPLENSPVATVNEKIAFSIKATGYLDNSNKEKPKMKMDMTLNGAMDTFKDNKITFLMTDNKMYISRSYFDLIFTGNLEKMPEELKAVDYIEFPLTMDESLEGAEEFKAYMDFMTSLTPEDQIKLSNKLGEMLKFDVPVAQEGRVFTIKLDDKALAEQLTKSVYAFADNFKVIMDELHVSNMMPGEISLDEMQKGFKESLAKEEVKSEIAKLPELIKGSSLNIKSTFADTTAENSFKINLNIKDFGKLVYNLDQKIVKSEKKEIILPEAMKSMGFEKAMELIEEALKTELPYVFADIENKSFMDNSGQHHELITAEKDGKTLIGFRQLFEGMGIEVSFDAKSKEPRITVDGTAKCVKTLIVGNTAYVTLEEVKSLGFDVEQIPDSQVYSISRIEKSVE